MQTQAIVTLVNVCVAFRHAVCMLLLAFLQAHKVYLEGTEHRTAAFNKLTQGDAHAAQVIEQRMKKLVKLQVGRCGCALWCWHCNRAGSTLCDSTTIMWLCLCRPVCLQHRLLA